MIDQNWHILPINNGKPENRPSFTENPVFDGCTLLPTGQLRWAIRDKKIAEGMAMKEQVLQQAFVGPNGTKWLDVPVVDLRGNADG